MFKIQERVGRNSWQDIPFSPRFDTEGQALEYSRRYSPDDMLDKQHYRVMPVKTGG